jgi:glycosyltransferase involved in cell wall biosynthesis
MCMKHVWMLNHYAQEPGGAGGTRHFSLGKHLLSHGWQTTILASSVELNTGKQRLECSQNVREDNIEGVSFLWIKTPSYIGNGLGRMLNMLSYTLRVLFPNTTRDLPRPNIILGSSVHPFAALSAAWLAKRHNVPFIFEVRDLWPQTLIDFGRIKKSSMMASVLHYIELWLYRRADKIVVLLPNIIEYISPLGIPENKVVWIPNGVDLINYPKPSKLVSGDEFTLMYFGSHGQANGLECLIQAMYELNKMPGMVHVHLRLIGDGPLKPKLIEQAKKMKLKNIRFENSVPKSKIPKLASQADAFVICVKDLPGLYKYGISMNKLFDYLAASKPIIIGSSAFNNPVVDAQAGFAVPPDNPKELAEAINRLVNLSKEERIAMGVAGRLYVEKYHGFNVLASRFADMLEQLEVA